MSTKASCKLPRLGLGTVQFGLRYGFTRPKSQRQVNAILAAAHRRGLNFVDTAPAYGDSEEKIGRYLKRHPRQRFFIATKLPKLSKSEASSLVRIRRAYESSLERSGARLGTRRPDLVQLHQSDDFILKNPLVWQVIGELSASRAFRHFGISVYAPREAEYSLKRHADLIAFIQVPYSVFDQRFRPLMRKWSRRGVNFLIRSSLLKGVIPAPTAALPAELKGLSGPKRRLERLCRRSGLSAAEMGLLFAATEPGARTTLVGVDSPAELLHDAASLSKAGRLRPYRRSLERLAVRQRRLIDPRRWRQL